MRFMKDDRKTTAQRELMLRAVYPIPIMDAEGRCCGIVKTREERERGYVRMINEFYLRLESACRNKWAYRVRSGIAHELADNEEFMESLLLLPAVRARFCTAYRRKRGVRLSIAEVAEIHRMRAEKTRARP